MARRLLLGLVLAVSGCERVPPSGGDAAVIDDAPTDAGAADAGGVDAGQRDAGRVDSGLPDAGLRVDAGSLGDAGPALDAGSPGVAVESQSSLLATTDVPANGVDEVVVVVALKDEFGDGVQGVTPVLLVTGTGNSTPACSTTQSNGQAICTFTSTVAETKTISLQTPVALSTTTRFIGGTAVLANSSFDGGPSTVTADGVAAATFTVRLIDARGNPVQNATPVLMVSGVGTLSTGPPPTRKACRRHRCGRRAWARAAFGWSLR
jgi:hypothetical protein